jgi:hypothetical protein
MRKAVIALPILMALSASPALAQFPANLTGPADPGPKFTCPPTGYFPPIYGVIGRNAGDGPAPTVAMSPCTPVEVKDAANAIGMARSHFNSPLGLKSVVTARFQAEGAFAADGRQPQKIELLDFNIHFGLPGARLMVTNGGKTAIRVVNDEYGWTEVSQGGAATPAMAQARELYALTKLTPFGAMWSVIEAEGNTKVSKVNGKTVLRGASPYDGLDVTVTLNGKNEPEAVQVVDGKTTYGARFEDYRSDLESDSLFRFPKHLVWTKNNRPYADLNVVYYRSNPYAVFPVPANVKRVSAR